MMGVNINDKKHPFTQMILAGDKTIETRRSRSLDSVIGKRVGIVRTGLGKATLVGYATIGKPVWYETQTAFHNDFDKHRVPAGSDFDHDGNGKWGYPVLNVEPVTPRIVTSRGIVLRKID